MGLDISMEEVKEALISEYINTDSEKTDLPKKLVIRDDDQFWTTMPLVKGSTYQSKMVWRENGTTPAIKGNITIVKDGCLHGIMDGTWATTMRTGAIAAITASKVANPNWNTIAMTGLGNTSAACMHMLINLAQGRPLNVRLVKYKEHAERFINRFKSFENVSFSIYDDLEACMPVNIIVSAMTFMGHQLLKTVPPGTVIVPIHMRGFQDCDAQVTHVIADDVKGINHFGTWDLFKDKVHMTKAVFSGEEIRKSEADSFMVYQYGTALSDLAVTKVIMKKAREQKKGIALPPDSNTEAFWM